LNSDNPNSQEGPDSTPESNLAAVVDFTNRILQSSHLDLIASLGETADGFKVELSGNDIALLLGHHAELLDALEHLGNRFLSRLAGEELHLVFDSSHYRVGREKELHLMAEKAAEKVRASGVPFSFDPMGPNERRIIHLALVEDSTVRTESVGHGAERRVTVYPA
jgi:spoIIIJ-associated protein